MLSIVEHVMHFARLDLDWKDDLAALPCLHQFGEAPFGGQPVWCQECNHRLALAQFLIKRLFPVRASLDSRLGVEIKKQGSVALRFQPALHVRRRRAVGAAVADKYRGHFYPLRLRPPWIRSSSPRSLSIGVLVIKPSPTVWYAVFQAGTLALSATHNLSHIFTLQVSELSPILRCHGDPWRSARCY
nr:hypothetical protein [Nitrosomonas sp. Nm58]